MVANADCAVDHKVHLNDFFLFVVDHDPLLLFHKLARFQPKSHIVEKLALFVLLRVEKEAEIVEDIIEEVMNNDAPLDRLGQDGKEFAVFLNRGEPIVGPIVFEMLINLAVELVW